MNIGKTPTPPHSLSGNLGKQVSISEAAGQALVKLTSPFPARRFPAPGGVGKQVFSDNL